MDTITFVFDGRTVTVPAGTTLLDAARAAGIEVPVICYHPHFTANALCRICVVEIEGSRTLVPACIRRAEPGMVVQSDSERVRRARRTILELLGSAVDTSEAPEIQAYAATYGADPGRLGDVPRRTFPLYDDNAFYVRDYSKCILCWRCVQACGEDIQYTFAIEVAGRGFDSRIATFFNRPIPESTCVYCGNCVAACPTGALKSKRELWLELGRSLDELVRQPVRRRRSRDRSP
jgi:NADH dehydrogenase/NADH:ubiquinone oxidoreductase subunit G